MTNPICWTCKNCSYKCAADCEHCVKQSGTQQFWQYSLLISRQSSSLGCCLAEGRGYKKATYNKLYQYPLCMFLWTAMLGIWGRREHIHSLLLWY